MLQEIVKKYGDFGDALISEVCYSLSVEDNGAIKITLATMNAENDYKFENIRLILSDISDYRFIEKNYSSSLIIYGAVLIEEKDTITVDFFPEITDDGDIINEESRFLIRCKHISYEVISKY